MRIIGALAAGIAGAEGGKAEIYKRGTAQRAVLYQDFEALEPTLLSPVTLGEYGQAVLYVNEYVDVVVTDMSGAQVRPKWTEGDSAAAVEVRSAKFPGTDYETALTGLGKPVDLITVLELLDTGIDSITTELDTLTGPFFNVKDADYGALGDGAHDDAPHIALAVAAAVAAGGGVVFFPAGIYRLATAGVVITGVTSLLGCGSRASKLVIDPAADADVISVTLDAVCSGNSIQGLSVDASDSLAKAAIYVNGGTAGGSCRIVGCALNGNGGLAGGVKARGVRSTVVSIVDCEIEDAGGAYAVDGYYVETPSTSPTILMRGGTVFNTSTSKTKNDIELVFGSIVGTRFENGYIQNAAGYANIRAKGGASGTYPVVVDGCLFENCFASDASLCSIIGEQYCEVIIGSGNFFGKWLTTDLYVGTASTARQAVSSARGYRTTTVGDATYTATPEYWSTEYLIVDGTALTVTLNEAPLGTRFMLMVENVSATTGMNLTLAGVTMTSGTEVFSIAAMLVRAIYLEYIMSADGHKGWTPIPAQALGPMRADTHL